MKDFQDLIGSRLAYVIETSNSIPLDCLKDDSIQSKFIPGYTLNAKKKEEKGLPS